VDIMSSSGIDPIFSDAENEEGESPIDTANLRDHPKFFSDFADLLNSLQVRVSSDGRDLQREDG